MVRLSKLPEISLHQDNKKIQREDLLLAQAGTVNIYPTSIGGTYSVETFQQALYSTEYIDYVNETNTLQIGNFDGATNAIDSNIPNEEIETIHFMATESITIGNSPNEDTDWDTSGTVTFNGSSLDMNVSGSITIQTDAFEIQAENVTLTSENTLTLGADASGDSVAQNIQVQSSSGITFDSSGGDITLRADTIDCDGNVTIYGSFDVSGDVVIHKDIELLGGVKINVMNESNDAQTHGIYFDSSGTAGMYMIDMSGYDPDGEHPTIGDDVSGNKTLYIRTEEGIVFESASGETFFHMNTTGNDAVSVNGTLQIYGDLDVTDGSLFTNGVTLDASGNINASGTIYASAFDISEDLDISGNFTGTLSNVTCDSLVAETSISTEGITLASNTITCSGEVITETLEADEIDVEGSVINASGIVMTTGTTSQFDILNVDRLETKTGGIVFEDGTLDCSGSITLGGSLVVSENATFGDTLTGSALTLLDSSGDAYATFDSSGTLTCTSKITCEEINVQTLTTGSNVTFNTQTGEITGKDFEVSGTIQATRVLTDFSVLDASGFTVTGPATATQFDHSYTDGSTYTLVDVSGNINVQGYVSILGNFETTTGDVTIDGTLTVQGDSICQSLECRDDLGDASGNTLTCTGTSITFDDDNYWDTSGLRVNNLYLENLTVSGNLILEDISEAEITNGGTLQVYGDFTVTTLNASGTLSIGNASGESIVLGNASASRISTTDDTIVLEEVASEGILTIQDDADGLTTIQSTSFVCSSSGFSTTIDASGGISVIGEETSTTLTSDGLTTGDLTTTTLRIQTELTFGDTKYYSVDDGGVLAQITVVISDVPVDTNTNVPTSPETYGPEYTVVLHIEQNMDTNDTTEPTKVATLVFTVNFGSFFNAENGYTATGVVGDTHLNGSDCIKNIVTNPSYDTNLDILSTVRQFEYSREGNTITFSGDDVSDLGDIQYSYYYVKSIGLGLSE